MSSELTSTMLGKLSHVVDCVVCMTFWSLVTSNRVSPDVFHISLEMMSSRAEALCDTVFVMSYVDFILIASMDDTHSLLVIVSMDVVVTVIIECTAGLCVF